jgi:CubicO group peptidase (beta-lactamase class C family)
MSLTLYNGEPQHETFAHMGDLFPTGTMKPSIAPFQFPKGLPIELPQTYEFNDRSLSTEEFIKTTDTSAVLVLKDGSLRMERYLLTGGRNVQWISWSVAKSFVSALIGIAIEDGLIGSENEPITRYVPSLTGSAYDGVRIKDVLQMSSGARWNEDYSNPDSDIHRLGAVMTGNKSLAAFVENMENERQPGTFCQYNSADTQALGMLVVEVTGCSIANYMQEKLCEPLGMESPGYWLLDNTGMELALGGLNLTARDFAKIGELYRNRGIWRGKQIVPKDWVGSSVTPDAPHLMPGMVIVGGHVLPLGYGYQWWVPEGDCGEFSAIGVYNQFVYVDPSRGVVIVKLSANRAYGTSPDEATNREMETIEFLRAIAREMD